MKTARRFLSLALALMLVLSLSVTAFASSATPSVHVTVANSRNGKTDAWDVSATTGQSVKAALDAVETPATIQWDKVPDYYNPAITHYALTSLRGYASTKFDASIERDQENLLDAGYDYEAITWYTGSLQGYGLINHNVATGEYTYIYAGYDWTYSSNKSAQIWDYMCCYNLQSDEIVNLVYDFSVSVWTTSTPIA